MIETDHKKIAHKLKKRGWDDNSISTSVRILKKSAKKKPKHISKLDNMVYWAIIFMIIFVNMLIFVGTIPLLIYFPEVISVLFYAILGISFGAFIDIMIRHHDFTHNHYFFAMSAITLFTSVFLISLLYVVKPIIAGVGFYINENPLLLLLAYIAGSIIPHIFYKSSEIK